MYIFNLYEDCNKHKASVASSSNLNNALASIKNIVSLYLNEWYKEKEFVTFRIEVIDQETNDGSLNKVSSKHVLLKNISII